MRVVEHLAAVIAFASFCLPVTGSVPAFAQDADTPLKIKSKPQANARGCRPGSSGVISVRVTFDKSGKVTEATTISGSGCAPFDRDALRAARAITFEPAKKKGVPVTTVKTVEYAFQIY